MRICYKDASVERDPTSYVVAHMERALLLTAPELFGDVVVVTSCNDGRHKAGSKHYTDQAVDVRVYGMRRGAILVPSGQAHEAQALLAGRWAKALAAVLGQHYDVVLESDHIHVEHDPKA